MFFFAGQHGDGVVGERRRDDDLGEHLGHLLGHRQVDLAVGRDHAAERRERVAGVRLAVRRGDVGADGDPARVGVLDDRDAGVVVVVRGPPGGVGVDVVVVGHLLAVQLLGVREPGAEAAVERGALVRVLAVAQHVGALPARAHPGREDRVLVGREHAAHPGGDGDVVGRGVPERRGRQLLPLGEGEAAGAHGGEHVGVAGRVDDDGDRRVVLRRGPHHRRAADVDLLDALVGAGAGGDGLGERVEVHHDEVERRDARAPRAAPRARACGGRRGCPACTAGCSVFTRPSRHSGKPVTCSTGVTGMPASAIRRAVAPVLTSSTPAAARPRGQLLDAGLVVDAQQGAADGDAVAHR